MAATVTQPGYLVLADISGYTFYLAGVELDHAHEILTDLLEIIVTKFRSALTIAKLGGICVSRTCHLIPLDDGARTRLFTNFTGQVPLPNWLARPLMKPFFRMVKPHETRDRMAELVAAEAANQPA